jgi:hypothetical protein
MKPDRKYPSMPGWDMISFTQMVGYLQCSAAFAPDDRTVYAWTGKEYHHAPMISRDRGRNWEKLVDGPDEDGRSICVSSKNKGLVVIGTTDSIWTAQDGEHFTKVQPGTGMVGGIFIHPETELIAVGSQKGIYTSEDRGKSFKPVAAAGLIGQIRSFSGGVRGKRAAYSVVMWSNYDAKGGMRGSNYKRFQGLFRSADLKDDVATVP